MAFKLQLKYIKSAGAAAQGYDVLGLQEVHKSSLLNDFMELVNPKSPIDDSLFISSTAITEKQSEIPTAKVRFQESAKGLAFDFDNNITVDRYNRYYNQGTSENTLKRYSDSTSLNKFPDAGKLSSMFLPTLLVSNESNTLVYDMLSQYLSTSQLSYSPKYSPIYMKHHKVATYVGKDLTGAYKVAWEELNDNETNINNIKSAMGLETLNQCFISDYYSPTLIYNSSVFTTNIKNVSDAEDPVRAEFNLNLNRVDKLLNINGIPALKDIREIKNAWHKTDLIGFASHYLPWNMYLNQVCTCKIEDLSTANQFASDLDTIKLQGVINGAELLGVKLVVDSKQLVDNNSLVATDLPTTVDRGLRNTSKSKISVSESWATRQFAQAYATLYTNCVEYPLVNPYTSGDLEDPFTVRTPGITAGSNSTNIDDVFSSSIQSTGALTRQSVSKIMLKEQYKSINSTVYSQGVDRYSLKLNDNPSYYKAGSLMFIDNTISLTSETGNDIKPAKVEIVSTKFGKNTNNKLTPYYGDVRIRTGVGGKVYVNGESEPREIQSGSSIHLYNEVIQNNNTDKTLHKIDICAGNEYNNFYLRESDNQIDTNNKNNNPGVIQLKSFIEPSEATNSQLEFAGITISDQIILQSTKEDGISFIIRKSDDVYMISINDIVDAIITLAGKIDGSNIIKFKKIQDTQSAFANDYMAVCGYRCPTTSFEPIEIDNMQNNNKFNRNEVSAPAPLNS